MVLKLGPRGTNEQVKDANSWMVRGMFPRKFLEKWNYEINYSRRKPSDFIITVTEADSGLPVDHMAPKSIL